MKEKITLLFTLLKVSLIFAQVGIGNTNPQATLDISASNQTLPANNDGILIPRIDSFPTMNPTATQDSMIVYLTTTDNTDAPGFYYWNNATTTWLPLGEATSGWELLGNTGTVNGTNFLGTTDNQALDIRTNNVIHARFTTNGKMEILNSGLSVYIGENAGAADPTTTDKQNVAIGTNAGQNITAGASNWWEGAFTTAVGYNALNSLTTGNRNTAIGNSAASSITTGNYNTAVGAEALKNATTSSYNSALGFDALENVNGARNTAIGYRALAGANNPAVGTGQENTAIGEGAGRRIHDGDENVWIGVNVDQYNTDGNQNTIIGTEAGAASGGERTINGRVLIGYRAGSGYGGMDNTLYIENSNSVTPLIYGEFDNDILRVNGQLQVGSSDDTIAAAIYSFPTTDGTNGQVLTTDGSGNVTWQNGGSGADTQDLSIDNTVGDLSLVNGGTVELKTIADSDDDTLVQVEENSDEDIIRFDLSGQEKFTMNSRGVLQVFNTGQSVMIGEGAGLVHDNSATRRNTLIGYEAGNDITTGFNNVALGWRALTVNVDGVRNTAIGSSVLDKDIDPDDTVAIGSGALGNSSGATNNTVAIGVNALSNSTDSERNVAIGKAAGANTDGGNNVLVGYESDWLNANSGATQNVIIGSGAGEAGAGGGTAYQGRVMIGYQAGRDSKTNNTLYIENSSSGSPLIGGDFATDKVGINTDPTTLTHTLNVGGSAKIDTLINLTPGTAPASPAVGDVYFDATADKLRVYTLGAGWVDLH